MPMHLTIPNLTPALSYDEAARVTTQALRDHLAKQTSAFLRTEVFEELRSATDLIGNALHWESNRAPDVLAEHIEALIVLADRLPGFIAELRRAQDAQRDLLAHLASVEQVAATSATPELVGGAV